MLNLPIKEARELPRKRQWRPRLPDLNKLFFAVVVLPVIMATVYFGFVASDVYVSESKFVVRAPDKPATSGLGVILQSAGFATAGDEVYAAASFVTSRDGLRAINEDEAFRKAFTRPEISIVDRFDPTGWFGSFEHLYKYFQDKVTLQNDTVTSISTLTVRAYNPEDARRFNEQLLEMSEATVNGLNRRGREDLVRYAEREVAQAQARSQAAAASMAAYRNRFGVIDPEKQAAVQMQMVSKLQDGIIAARTELSQLERFTPLNPRIPILQAQIRELNRQVDVELGRIAGDRRSLAASAVQFQRLALENEVASKQLGAALAALSEARNDSRRQQAYVERIVEPNLPDSAVEPRRLRGILATLALALLAYGILRMLLAGVREHAL